MTGHAAIVTGGLRGLGKAMAFGLAQAGHSVLAVGHLAEDVDEILREADRRGATDRLRPLVADIRNPSECDRVIEAALEAFGIADILVNSAGLTFTYIWPDKYRRTKPMRFWELTDDIVQNVMDTNYVAADQMARRIAPLCVEKGWGRIVNVTTKLTTMNQVGAMPYGSSKAALEMATEVWAREAAGTGLTINVINPGAGANTLGMAQEMREWSANGTKPKLVEPEDMVPPLLWVVSEAANGITGWRYDANTWDTSISPEESHERHGAKAGMILHPGAQ
jgi:NAD(P)-dependent dehydrogenase (short-subunit alcohol dehydrogenase family)